MKSVDSSYKSGQISDITNYQPHCRKIPPPKTINIHPIKTPLVVLTLTILIFIPFLYIQDSTELSIIALDIETQVPEWIDYGGGVQKVLELDNGELVIQTFIDGDIVIFKISKQGEIIWQKTYPAFDYCTGFIQTSDEGFALTVGTYEHNNLNQTSTETQGALIKTRENGEVEWIKTYEYQALAEDDSIRLAGLQQTDKGYILVLSTGRHGIIIHKTDQEGEIQKTVKHEVLDCFYFIGGEIIPTQDGGYVLIGFDFTEEEHTTPLPTGMILKINQELNQQWETKLTNFWIERIIQMKDESFIISGWGNTPPNNDYQCIVKIDEDGKKLYEKSMESALKQVGYPWSVGISHIIETEDEGLAILTTNNLVGADTIGLGGYGTALVKTDSTGNRIWAKDHYPSTTQKTGCDLRGWTLTQLKDGGYIIGGSITYDSGYYVPYVQQEKPIIIRTDELGNQLWNQTFTGPLEDEWVTDVIQTTEGGFALTGYTNSYGEGDKDAWVVKTDKKGKMEWNYQIGGDEHDLAKNLVETKDRGIIVAGNTKSLDNKKQQNIWLVKLNEKGEVIWKQTYKGEENESIQRLIKTADNGLMIGGNINANTIGNQAMFLMKLNEKGEVEWRKSSLTEEEAQLTDLQETGDKGFIFSGIKSMKTEFYDYYGIYGTIIKIDAKGKIEWSRTLDSYPDNYYKETHTVIHAVAPINEEIILLGEEIPDLGWCDYAECEHHPTFIMKIDLEGNLIQNNRTGFQCSPFSTFRWNEYYTFLDLEKKHTGELMIAGKENRFGDYLIWEINQNGSVKNEYSLPDTSNYSKPWIKAISLDKDEKIIVAAEVNTRCTSGLSRDWWMAEINTTGSIEWYKTYGNTGFNQYTSNKMKITLTNESESNMGVYSGFNGLPMFMGMIIILWVKRRKKK